MTHSAENLIWPLIEAENLRGGLACKAAIEIKYDPERKRRCGDFFRARSLALQAEEV